MTTSDSELRPLGFGGHCPNWESLLPRGRRLVLPAMGRIDAGTLMWPDRADAPGCPDGAPWDVVVIDPLTESMGKVEGVLERAAGQLGTGGSLLLEAENLHSPRSLRRVLEGRVGPCDPIGSVSDPTQYLMPSRAIGAVAGAGLWIRDVIQVPSHPHELHGGFVRDMFHAGMLPITHAGGMPPWKVWIHGEKLAQRPAGTVLIGPGDPTAQLRTRRCLEGILPADWDIIECDADAAGGGTAGDVPMEIQAINRGVTRAKGHIHWFLRAGAEVDRVLFRGLLAETVRGAAVPLGRDGCCDGDLSGLMIERTRLLQVGPLDEQLTNLQVAAEDFLLRMQTTRGEVTVVAEGSHKAPPMAVTRREAFQEEGRLLLDRWEVFSDPQLPEPVNGVKAMDPDDRERTPPWEGRRPKVSLCMIARDEETFLPECLRRAAPCVDEIVLVDTGSTDRTVEIAESFGARVVHFPWCDDFATARNVGLEQATGDWILVLDADEHLEPGTDVQIRELVQKPGVAGYHLHFTNNYTDGKSLGVLMVRLFRNLPGVAYENRIHEQVTPSLSRLGEPLGLTLVSSGIEVAHEGYREEVMLSKNKVDRNDRLFRLQLEEHPDDVYSLYKYGDFLRGVPGREDEALEVLERCFQKVLERPPVATRTMPFAGEVGALIALARLQRNQVEQARAVLDTCLRRCLSTPNLHYIAAGLALTEQNNDEAIAHFEACLRYRGEVLVVPIQEGITGHVAVAGIAQAHMQKGDTDSAQRLLEQAIAMEPGWEVSHMTLARLYLQQGEIGRALQVLTDHLRVHPDSPGAAQQATLLLQRIGQTGQARAMGQHALRLYRERQQTKEANNVERVLASLG